MKLLERSERRSGSRQLFGIAVGRLDDLASRLSRLAVDDGDRVALLVVSGAGIGRLLPIGAKQVIFDCPLA